MKKIPVTKGTETVYALVDDEDFLHLKDRNWFLDDMGYARCSVKKEASKAKTNRRMHFFIWRAPQGFQTDHINCNKLDNQKANLRAATRQQNSANRNVYRNNRLKIKGVCLIRGVYRARIRVDGKLIYLGGFKDPTTAGLAYTEAAKKYFGEFSRA